MKLYHGSDCVIESPDVSFSRKNLDFGPGFYATSFRQQAERWALRRSMRSGKTAVINVFDFSQDSDLNILTFDDDRSWVEFVCNCRRGSLPPAGTDIVYGGVADDKVYMAIDMYFRGLWDMDTTLRALKFYGRNDQYCFVTQSAIDHALAFAESYEVDR